MKSSAILVGVLETAGDVSATALFPAAVEYCEWIEVRADLIPELDPTELRERCKGRRLLYTLRVSKEEERDRLSLAQRHRLLRKAAEAYDFVTLKGECDLVPEVLRAIAPERRIVSSRGSVTGPECLEAWLGTFTRTPARLFRFEVESGGVEDGLAALQFLHRVHREDVTAYAEDASGAWTRVLAPRLGAPIAFARVPEDGDTADFEPTIRDLVLDYGFPDLYPAREIFAIIGQPVSGSLSPRVHNGAYRANGFGRLFLSFPADSFQQFWHRLVLSGAMEAIGFPIMGLTVASPHKESALEVAKHRAPLCRQCGASNLLVRRDNEWTASTTDPEGIFHNTTARPSATGCKGGDHWLRRIRTHCGSRLEPSRGERDLGEPRRRARAMGGTTPRAALRAAGILLRVWVRRDRQCNAGGLEWRTASRESRGTRSWSDSGGPGLQPRGRDGVR